MPDYSLYNSTTAGLRPWEELLSPAPARWSPLAEALFPGVTTSQRSLGDVLLGLTGGAPSAPPPESMAPAAIGPGRMSPAYSARVYDTDPNATLQAYSPSLWEEIRQSDFGRRMFGEPNAVLDGPGRRGVVGVVGGIVGEPARAAGKLSKGTVADLANAVAGGEFGGNIRTALNNIGRRPEDQEPMKIDQAMALARQQEIDTGNWGASTVPGNIALGLAESAPKIALMPAGGGLLTQAGMNTAVFGLDDGGVLDGRAAATGLLLPGIGRLTGTLAKQGIKSGVAAGANWLKNPAMQKALHVAANQAGVNAVMLAQDAGELGRLAQENPQEFQRHLAETLGSNLAFVPWELRSQRSVADREPTREPAAPDTSQRRLILRNSDGQVVDAQGEALPEAGNSPVLAEVRKALAELDAEQNRQPEEPYDTNPPLEQPAAPSWGDRSVADVFLGERATGQPSFMDQLEARLRQIAPQEFRRWFGPQADLRTSLEAGAEPGPFDPLGAGANVRSDTVSPVELRPSQQTRLPGTGEPESSAQVVDSGEPQAAPPAPELSPLTKNPAKKAQPKGNIYSAVFEMFLGKKDYGRSDKVHFNRANAALDAALRADPVFAAQMEKLIPGISKSVSSTDGRKTPKGYTWHHHQDAGRMQLMPTEQHASGSIFQDVLHPGPDRAGGYAIWAIPAGAPPRHRRKK